MSESDVLRDLLLANLRERVERERPELAAAVRSLGANLTWYIAQHSDAWIRMVRAPVDPESEVLTAVFDVDLALDQFAFMTERMQERASKREMFTASSASAVFYKAFFERLENLAKVLHRRGLIDKTTEGALEHLIADYKDPGLMAFRHEVAHSHAAATREEGSLVGTPRRERLWEALAFHPVSGDALVWTYGSAASQQQDEIVESATLWLADLQRLWQAFVTLAVASVSRPGTVRLNGLGTR